MTKIDVDTTKLRYAAEDLKTSAKDYRETIVELYEEKLKKMPDNKVWYGEAADGYIKKSLLEEKKILKHSDDMTSLSKILTDYVDALESGVKSNLLK